MADTWRWVLEVSASCGVMPGLLYVLCGGGRVARRSAEATDTLRQVTEGLGTLGSGGVGK